MAALNMHDDAAPFAQSLSVAGLLPDLPVDLLDVLPAPAAFDRKFWTTLAPELRTTLVKRGEQALALVWPDLPASLYQLYVETGDRVGYETPYFARRCQLNALVLAECVEGQGRFLSAISAGVLSICDEAGWQIPAHNSLVRGGVRAALPDPANPVIDLFAAETGALLAVLAGLLQGQLSSDVSARIDAELQARIFTPYLNCHFWWMGAGDEKMNNWTAWCTENVLRCVFAHTTSQALRRAVVEKAAFSLDAYLKEFAADGACEEGAHYYRRGTLCFAGALDVLDAASSGAFSGFWQSEKLRNMADFAAHLRIAGRRVINFSDCPADAELSDGREFRLAQAIGSDALTGLVITDRTLRKGRDLPDDINLSYRLIDVVADSAMALIAAKPWTQNDIFYPSIGLMIARDNDVTLAVKAGDNGSDHNHNDVGTVTLYRGATPILIDLGVGTYTKQTFSAQRYDIWTMQSAWHNLPSFGGVMQQAGARFAAQNVAVSLGDDAAQIDMDLAQAYPAEARVESYLRCVRLIKGQAVQIVDTYAGEVAPTLSLIFASAPKIDGMGLSRGETRIDIDGAGTMTCERVALSDAKLIQSWGEAIYRVLIPFAANRLRLWVPTC
ncbi:MAG: heparinase II/III family protein [Deltaproteobacteria bacterium]